MNEGVVNLAQNSMDLKMNSSSMSKLILTMSLPAIFSMLVQALYNVVDSVFVSWLPNPNAFYAVSLASPLQFVMLAVAVGTGVGVSSLISRRLGAGRQDEASKAATHGIVLALISAFVFVFVGIFASKPFIALFTDKADAIAYGTQYLSIVLIFSFGAFLQILCEKVLQSTGNMILPMFSQLIGAITNLILDPIFIFGWGPIPAFEVAGAAIATVLGQIIGMIFVVIVLMKKCKVLKISLRKFRFNADIVKNIYIVGFPAMIMQAIGSLTMSGINGIIAAFSSSIAIKEAATSIYGVYFKVQSFIFMPVFGLSQGCMPIMGYNFGARRKKKLYSALKWQIIFGAVIMAIGVCIFQLGADLILQMFSATDDMYVIGVKALRILSLCFLPAAVGIAFSTMFQAVGKGFYSLMMSLLRQLILILPLAFLLVQFDTSYQNGLIWYSYVIAEAGSLLIAFLFLYRLRKREFKALDAPLE